MPTDMERRLFGHFVGQFDKIVQDVDKETALFIAGVMGAALQRLLVKHLGREKAAETLYRAADSVAAPPETKEKTP